MAAVCTRWRVRAIVLVALSLACPCTSAAMGASAGGPLFRVGSILSLAGQALFAEHEHLVALRAGVAYANDRGLLPNNGTLWLVGPLNDQFDRSTSVEAAIALRDENVVAVFGPNSSPNVIASQLFFKKYNVLQCTIATSRTLSDTNEYPFFFRTVPPNSQAIPALVQLCVRMRWRKIGVLATNDEYGQSLSHAMQAAATAVGIAVVPTEGAIAGASGVVDFSAQVATLSREDVRIICLFAYNAESLEALRAASRLGMVGPRHVWLSEQSKQQMETFLRTVPAADRACARDLFSGMMYYFGQFDVSGRVYADYVRYYVAERVRELNISAPANATSNAALLPTLAATACFFDCVLAVALGIRDVFAQLNGAGPELLQGPGQVTLAPVQVRNATVTFGRALVDAIERLEFEGASGAVNFNSFMERDAQWVCAFGMWSIVSGVPAKFGWYSNTSGLVVTDSIRFYNGSLVSPGDGVPAPSSLSGGQIAGIVVGSCAGAVVAAALTTWLCRSLRRARRAAREEAQLLKAEEERRREAHAEAEIARQGERTKTAFLANVSREIRAPLTSILGMAQILEDEPATQPPVRESLGMIRRCGEALLLVLGDILDFSRMEADQISVAREPFDAMDVVEDVISIHAETARAKGVAVSFHVCCLCARCQPAQPSWARPCLFEYGMLFAEGDRGRFTQVLGNLVGNAVKFSATGEVVVCVSMRTQGREQGECCAVGRGGPAGDAGVFCAVDEIRGDAERPPLVFEVRDTGIGIATRDLPRLFERFRQCDNSLAKKYQGTGLGLAISARLVRLMSGAAGVRSRLAAGSVFWVSLPAASAPPEDARDHRTLRADEEHVTFITADASLAANVRTCCRLVGSAFSTDSPPLDASANVGRARSTLLVDGDAPGLSVVVEGATRLKWTIGREGVSGQAEVRKPLTRARLREVLAGEAAATAPNVEPAGAASDERVNGLPEVLVVDDNAVNRRVASRFLDRLGLEAVCASSGTEALLAYTASARGRFSLVLMDLYMPTMSGVEATRTLRWEEVERGWPRVPVFALTASTEGEAEDDCRGAGMDGVLAKPLTPGALEELVRRLRLRATD